MIKTTINLGDTNKFVAYKTNNISNCLELCKLILKNYNMNNFGSPTTAIKLLQEKNNILTYCEDNPKQLYEYAIKCIDTHLEKGYPIIVGVNHTLNYNCNEGTTDHFVVIYGRKYDETLGLNCYMYYEVGKTNVKSGYNDLTNRFVYKPGDKPEFYDEKSERMDNKRFDVVQIRPNYV